MVLSSLPNLEGFHCLFRLFWAGWTIDLYILRTIYCANGPPAYNTWLKNTTTKTVTKLRNEVRRLESLVKKLQSELASEREYCATLEEQLRSVSTAE